MNDLLLAKARSGDPAAVERLVVAQIGWLRARARGGLHAGLRADADSQDLVQDVVVQLLESDALRTLRDEEHLRALLARILSSDLIDRRRRAAFRRLDPHRIAAGAASATRPSEHAMRDERRALLHAAFERLSLADREVLQMRVWDGLAFRDIAERLGCSEDGARMRCNRALARLADAAELALGGGAPPGGARV